MGWHNHDGPFYHSVEELILEGDIPLEIRSAGLSFVLMYSQSTPGTACWTELARLATNYFHLLGLDFNHYRMTLEPENK